MTPEIVHVKGDILSLSLRSNDDFPLEIDGQFEPGLGVGVQELELFPRKDDGKHSILEAAIERGGLVSL